MTTHQKLKAAARQSAKSAPPADPKIAAEAIAEATGTQDGKSCVEPVYKTQTKVGGKNSHREKDKPISEFDDPAANIVKPSS